MEAVSKIGSTRYVHPDLYRELERVFSPIPTAVVTANGATYYIRTPIEFTPPIARGFIGVEGAHLPLPRHHGPRHRS